AVSITDPRERTLPNVGLIDLEDAETGEIVTIDSSSPRARRAWEANAIRRDGELRKMLLSMSIAQIPVVTGRDYVRNLVAFFRLREHRL
ncbi:MAG: DUF58 domain-containing protein, partial [bacterium]|nr:DUF58 domain-containing protein [bacterium]